MPWTATAKPPIQSSPAGIDEVGEAHVRPPLALLHLLAQHRHAGLVIAGEDEDVVALAAAAPQADACRAPSANARRRSCRASPAASANRLRALSPTTAIVEDRRIIAGQLPGAEEGRPVDAGRAVRAAASR